MRDSGRLMCGRIILEDGSIFRGTPFGAEGETGGELVFNTALTGYQEVLTDPSYHGQVVTMTYPLIGNYGINPTDDESEKPHVAGFVVREVSRIASNWMSSVDLPSYLKTHGIVALEGVDTRAVTRRLREKGSMTVYMTTESLSDDELRDRLHKIVPLAGRDSVSAVTCSNASGWGTGREERFNIRPVESELTESSERPLVVAYDFGAKRNIYRSLHDVGFNVRIVPSNTSASEVLDMGPEGIFLSNGPGDPRALTAISKTVGELLGRVPVFGICLGHQILAQAIGAETVKLKFGHHGSNHPVMHLPTGRVEVTSQNHCYAVSTASLEKLGVEVSHINLNDETVEGMSLPSERAFSVQYHPEAAPGPHDSFYLFEMFRRMVHQSRGDGVEQAAS